MADAPKPPTAPRHRKNQVPTGFHAIPVTYHGTRFRSHLEADWAATFDQLGWTWSYEPEPVRGDSVNYLPDFHLPAQKLWCEVKGPYDERPHKPAWLAAALGSDGTHARPAVVILRAAGPGRTARWDHGTGDHQLDLCLCPRCEYATFTNLTGDARCRICGMSGLDVSSHLELTLAQVPRWEPTP